MINWILISVIGSFIVTLFVLPLWIRKARQIDLVWEDMNKMDSEKVAGSGGIVVMVGFLFGAFIYIAYRVFYLKSESFLVQMLALTTSVLILGGVGFIDDLIGWMKGGLSKRVRLVMVGIAAIPLMVINAGESAMNIPILGVVEFGLFYPLIFIPLGIIGATATYNFLAGFNGLEAGLGVILMGAVGVVAFLTGNSWISILALCMASALLAFLLFNFCPAKVFPGDSLTYAVGGMVAIFSILGDFEKVAIFFFIPVIIEVFLKLRGGLKKQSFGKPDENGYLGLRYDRIYSLNHLAIYLLNKTNWKATERRVVYCVWAFQVLIVVIGFGIFWRGIVG